MNCKYCIVMMVSCTSLGRVHLLKLELNDQTLSGMIYIFILNVFQVSLAPYTRIWTIYGLNVQYMGSRNLLKSRSKFRCQR